LLALGISLLAITLFVGLSDPEYFVSNPIKNWGWFFIGLLAYLVNVVIRAVRLNRIYRNHFGQNLCLWSAACGFYSSLNFLLPAKLGEFSLPMLIQRFFGEKILDNIPVILGLRVMDVGTLFAVAGLAALFVGYTEWVEGMVHLLWLAGGGLTCLLIALGVPVIRRFLAGKIELARNRLAGHFLYIGLTSFLLAGVFFLQVLATALALGAPGALIAGLTVFIFTVLTRIVPADGLANIGSHHLAWFFALTILGMPRDEAMSVAVLSHLVFVFFVIFGGIVAGGLYFLGKRNEKIIG
jgi:hypothetical protein